MLSNKVHYSDLLTTLAGFSRKLAVSLDGLFFACFEVFHIHGASGEKEVGTVEEVRSRDKRNGFTLEIE